MKFKVRTFLVSIALCLCLFGCGDEGVLLNDLVPSGPSPLRDVGPVPEDIQSIIWGKDVDTLMVELKAALAGDRNIRADSLIHKICLRREQEAYYTKYISAGGVAIIGNGYIPNNYFYVARDIVLGMTRKRPELREHLSPTRENRPGVTQHPIRHDDTGRTTPSRKFRMILVHFNQDPVNALVPEVRLANNVVSYPILGIGGVLPSYGRVLVHSPPAGISKNISDISIGVFVHEFAHAIHMAIEILDTDFDARLEAAYAATKENGSYFGYVQKTKWEYWAESAEAWFLYLSLKGKEHAVKTVS